MEPRQFVSLSFCFIFNADVNSKHTFFFSLCSVFVIVVVSFSFLLCAYFSFCLLFVLWPSSLSCCLLGVVHRVSSALSLVLFCVCSLLEINFSLESLIVESEVVTELLMCVAFVYRYVTRLPRW